ncbi:MAG: Uma2 family endonuclease [Leptolyngbyaceae cyanobacterium]|uniref:Uma2 family endonuclease n=1 Tax=Leptodesmis sichuanensis TaxID=2906798 RepID=UPI001F197533|nr:Uma2 family endonuclease [Leptodesmis sichuanensis]UIE39250.1 Uma2 family endonuclease [Leptodesmis sichuanensis A121]
MSDLLAPAQQITLTEISWEGYETILNLLGDRPVRVTYSQGVLELMILSYAHERYKRLLSRLLETLTEELNIPIASAGSTTFKRKKLERGLEPDECFYIGNEFRVRGQLSLDLAEDPPPDLAIEVDITHSSIDRMEIYARLGVPEVWRWEQDQLQFWQLQEGQYSPVNISPTLPQISATTLMEFMALLSTVDETSIIRRFRAWVRENLITREEDS